MTGVLTAYPGGPLEVLVNNTKYGGQRITGVTTDANSELVYTMERVPDGVPDGSGNFVSERPARVSVRHDDTRRERARSPAESMAATPT